MPKDSEITAKNVFAREACNRNFSPREKSCHAKVSGKTLNDTVEEVKEKIYIYKLVYQLQHRQ